MRDNVPQSDPQITQILFEDFYLWNLWNLW